MQIEPHSKPKYRQRGRPHAEQPPDYHVWQPGDTLVERNTEAIDHVMRTRDKFVIAANVLGGKQTSRQYTHIPRKNYTDVELI